MLVCRMLQGMKGLLSCGLPGRFLATFTILVPLSVPIMALAVSGDKQSLDEHVQQILGLDADPDYGEYLASECQTCHGGTQSAGILPISPLPADYIVRALLEYKTKVRSNEVMQTVASGLGDDEMAALAAYFKK